MADDRTPEQRRACDALREAIDAVAKAYDDPGLLMEYVVVTAHHLTEADGDTATSVSWIVSDELPLYRAIGLLDYAATRHRHCINSHD